MGQVVLEEGLCMRMRKSKKKNMKENQYRELGEGEA